ncbi:MAG TPA: 2-oxo acid dehydrogenase subunit E2 [Candidatus Limnocylindrales bacterium]|nr:2-oxo acid dehydrogenase subunit E2 [Candidatus Limnocylindrales bacterium]
MPANEIHFPDLGDFHDVLVIDVMVKAGDRVEVDTPLVTLETDKATMDVPSPSAGVIAELHVAKGDKVNSGGLLATLADAGTSSEGAKPEAAAEAKPKGGAGEAEPVRSAEAAEPDEGGDTNEVEPVESAEAPTVDEDRKKPKAEPVETAEMPKADEGGRGAAEAQKPARAAKPGGAQRTSGSATVAASTATTTAPPPPASSSTDEAAFAKAHASPSVRAFARELGVDLGRVRGSGRKGRVTSDDVKAFVKTALTGGGDAASAAPGGAGLPRVAAVDFTKFGPVEIVPLTRIQRISGPRLHASWVNLPHVTQFEDADVTELEEARRWLKLRAASEGIGLTSLAFVLRACVLALKAYPKLGASLDSNGQNLVLKKYCHLGFAADTPDGLVVPVIRDADRMDVFELARALGELSGKARTGKLSAAEMQGGCFTVSNLGGIGGTAFTPIINAPEVAVLGISRAVQKPVWKDGSFVPRLMLPLSLSYDHRVVDGADGARFVGFLAHALADVAGLMAPP